MDWVDYRKHLGVGLSDEDKRDLFVTKMSNALSILSMNYESGFISFLEYYDFCSTVGVSIDTRLSEEYYWKDRLATCIRYINNQRNDLVNYISYYIAFVNSLSLNRDTEWNRDSFIRILEKMFFEAHIPYDIYKSEDEFFVCPKGVPELDDALVSQPLEWLNGYPAARNMWAKALKDYSEELEDAASDVADKFRKSLEAFFQEFFGGGKSLENYKSEYGCYLRRHGVPKEISGNLETLLQLYTNYMNRFAKHRDATTDNILEYLMYQTGNVIRLLITLKKDEA